MDKNIEASINGRKNAFFAAYEVKDKKMLVKIDELFGEIEKLGAKCKDVGEFETKFAASPLNQQYLDLFTEIATSMASKQAAGQVASSMAGGVMEGMARNALGGVVSTRAAVYQKAYDEARKVPGLGDVIDIGEKASYAMHLEKLFKSRKKKQDE